MIGDRTTTDDHGRFRFESLPAKALFTLPRARLFGNPQTFLKLDGDDEVVVTMQSQGVIRGRVIDASTGKPIESFNVRMTFSPDRRRDEPTPA